MENWLKIPGENPGGLNWTIQIPLALHESLGFSAVAVRALLTKTLRSNDVTVPRASKKLWV